MNDKELMLRAIRLSEESVKSGGGPFGAVIARNGEVVAEALQKSFFGPVTPQVPASILQLHQDVTVIADMDALALCPAE